MKDSINLVGNFVSYSPAKDLGLENLRKRLKKINFIFACSFLLLLVSLTASIFLGNYENRSLTEAKTQEAAFSPDAKIISIVLTRQAQLSAIKKGAVDFRVKTGLIQKNIPNDVVLTNLHLSPTKTSLTAQTKSNTSLSQFIRNLKVTGSFKTISLVGASFDDKSGIILFSLECFTD